MTEIYERNLNVSVSKLNDTEIFTKASLLDLNHNIRVELTVDIVSKTIMEKTVPRLFPIAIMVPYSRIRSRTAMLTVFAMLKRKIMLMMN